MKKILDHIFFLRPMLLLPIWSVMILGTRMAAMGSGSNPFQIADLSDFHLHLSGIMLASGLMYAAVFVYNQIYDLESDKINGRVIFLPQKLITITAAYILSALLFVAALVLAFYMKILIGILVLIIGLIGFIYSHPKINYQSRSGKALWSNMFGAGMIPYLIGWAAFSDHISIEAVFKSLPYFFAAGAIYLNSALPDRDGDRQVGKRTFAVLWSVEHIQTSAMLRTIIAAILAQMSGDFAMLITCLLTLPFLIRARSTGNISHSATATRIAILIASIMAVLYYPGYLLIIAVVFIATLFYYRKRFGIEYPSLRETA